jgi:hypothetical protein
MNTETNTSSSLAVNDIAELVRGFDLSLRARNRSAKTIKGYIDTAHLFRESPRSATVVVVEPCERCI